MEPLAPRYMAVKREGCVELSVARVPSGVTSVSVPMHPRNSSLGDRVLNISDRVLIEAEVSSTLNTLIACFVWLTFHHALL